MKKSLTVALMLLMALQLGAQSKEVQSLLKNYEKYKEQVQDVKRGEKPATWIRYAQTLTNAYSYPTNNLWIGLSSLESRVVLKDQRALSTEYKDIQGEQYEVVKYEDKDLYYNADGKLSFWIITNPVIKGVDVLDEAYKAYDKAAGLDTRGSSKSDIQEGLTFIANNFINDAMAAYTLGNYADASVKFEKSFIAASHPALNVVDTTIVYYVGLTALMEQNYQRAEKFFNKCLEMGFESAGDTYANLAETYKQLGDMEKSKELLSMGFTKFPDSQSILVALINAYLESNDDPNKVLEFIQRAQQNEPNNPSLYYAEGNVLKNLGKFEEAVHLYEKSIEIDPNFFFGYFQLGQAYYDKAVDIQTAASDELDDQKYMKMVEELDQMLGKAIAPFEKSLELIQDEEIGKVVVEYLKNIYFRLRTKSPEYEASYEKYNKMLEQH
ncbi:MAG: tetratricopeptide repeat protein [Bacteroidales bacterium]|jgi:tetratricopeptide (TPR) repeat protein|nr:tetratricopeptide repeat protein [Bacteroidales bacterium]MDD2264449.1 tetratricopeptide repeat protein [Bacteroidales bacterium]MDD2831684.1 tetratricopeptide repeat protein [Bacteroidales bacterium]MDD3208911.1 tetratricopeptide repeat protein [Bacteroidales bacterium]MDD3697717.1 tetratricopeptide repeat protein [Bacteroidales bacterium]